MPQMAPIWWSSMFMVFILTLLVMVTCMYFFNLYSLKKNSLKKYNFKNMNWKW